MGHFMSNDNANSVLSEYASKIKTLVPTEITWANYQLLTEEQKASKRWLIIDYPDAGGGNGSAVFTITLTGDGEQEDPYVVDKTPAEVKEAYNAHQDIQLLEEVSGLIYPLIAYDEDINYVFRLVSRSQDFEKQYTAVGCDEYTLPVLNATTWDTIEYNSYWDTPIQCKDMPTASATYVNEVVQYIGSTNANYTNGYFYKCVLSSGSYSWQRIDVQPHQSISGKADKVSGATNGNFASLDANGNLADSGKKASDFMADGTVGVAKGGTGATTLTSGAALIGNGTGAVQTRAITNNTSKATAPAGSTNLATMNSLLYGMQNYNNRANAVNAADTNYTTVMARGIYATTTDLTPGTTALTNGVIALVYE